MEEKNDNKEYWFKRKRYGYGWTPASREGITVTLTYMIAVFWLIWRNSTQIDSGEAVLFDLVIPIGLLTLLLIYINYKKGEKLKWQWGEKSRSDSSDRGSSIPQAESGKDKENKSSEQYGKSN